MDAPNHAGGVAMSIEIPADLQAFVTDQLRLGGFGSEQQVVAEGLRLLKAEQEETVAGIQAGLADAAAGRMQSLQEAFADLRREFGLESPAAQA
jgi:predicted transcriptional regulator